MIQDRFKFRAYDKKCKKMIYDTLIQCTTTPRLLSNILSDNDEYIATMQSTGLSDENGKLIYEGDIVKTKYGTYQINFEIGSFMLVDKTDSCSLYGFKNCWNDNVYPLSQLYFEYENEEYCIDEVEVIGNIYENPELLEDL